MVALALLLLARNAISAEVRYTDDGYRLPTPEYPFEFPRDHGSHPEFRIEWWYLTGHLHTEGRTDPYGFQVTFFRYALAPHSHHEGGHGFGTNQLFMAHMALADPATGRYLHEERLNRDGWDAYAKVGDLDLRNGNWRMQRTVGETMQLAGTVRGDISFTLTLTPAKPKVIFGNNGLSRKGADPTAASWYITFPRLDVAGSLAVDGTPVTVTGEAWMDHEISSSQLGEDQVGWDWASMRFDDGREIMVYILRRTDGTPDPFSTLAWIDEQGALSQVGPDRFTWTARRSWTSPVTGGQYPIDIDLVTTDPATGAPASFRIRPLMDAQEMAGHLGGIPYWEGACEILNPNGQRVGEAYVELTGYAGSIQGALR